MQRKARGFRQTLRLESLERRELFAGDLILESAPLGPQTPAERLALYVTSHSWIPNFSPDLQKFNSSASLDTKLAELVSKYWEGVFDKPVTDVNPFGYFPYALTNAVAVQSSAGQLEAPIIVEPVGVSVMASTIQSPIPLSGINEANLVSTSADGFLYIATTQGISVVDLRDPAAMTSKALAVTYDDYNGRVIVSGNRLVRISYTSETINNLYGTQLAVWKGATKVELFDISNRTVPEKIKTFSFDGQQLAASLHNGRLTLVSNSAGSLILPRVEVIKGSDGVERFESASTYLARNRDAILSTVMPDYRVGDATTGTDIGTWDDVTVASDLLSLRLSVIELDVESPTPQVVDADLVIGASAQGVYTTDEHLYLYSQVFSALSTYMANGAISIVALPEVSYVSGTNFYKLSISGDEVEANDMAFLEVDFQDASWMNEADGVLRVAGSHNGEAVIYTLGQQQSDWKQLGKLSGIAPGQLLLSAAFDGDYALITTGSNTGRFPGGLLGNDPLHGIDLSNPAAPVELSEIVIPGFNLFLEKIDQTHWLGIGYAQNESGWDGRLQISMYDTTDWTKPTVVDTWVADIGSLNWWGQIDRPSVNYDHATGLLSLSSGIAPSFNLGLSSGRLPAFKIDPSAKDPIREIEGSGLGESTLRTLVYGDHLYSVTNTRVVAQSIDHLNLTAGQVFYLQPTETSLFKSYTPGQTESFYVLAGWDPSQFKLQSLEVPKELTATFSQDGQLTVRVPEDANFQSSEILVKYRYKDLPVATIRVIVNLNNSVTRYSDAHAKISGRFETDSGQSVTSLAAGEEAWLVLTAQDLRPFGDGIFAAYFNVDFTSDNVTVIGEPKFLNQFTNGRQAVTSGRGYTSIGAFGDATLDSTEPQDVVRFRIRVDDSSPVSIKVTPATGGTGREFLVYGDSLAINPARVESAILRLNPQTQPAGEADTRQDFNGDGIVSGLDVLQIVNFINNRPETTALNTSRTSVTTTDASFAAQIAAFDLTGDGDVSGLDVLQIVNAINTRGTGFSSAGEGEPGSAPAMAAQAVDQAFGDLPTDGWMKKSRRS